MQLITMNILLAHSQPFSWVEIEWETGMNKDLLCRHQEDSASFIHKHLKWLNSGKMIVDS